MIYNIKTGNFSNFDKYKENILQPRSYFIPYSSKEELDKTDIRTERYSSSRVAVLSGKWDFKYYASANELPEKFNSDEVKMDKISVPSVWQRTGYEKPFYVNSRYQFPVKPPSIPEDCSVGVYSKKFSLDEVEGNYTITFMGVVSCLDLFVNGKYVGYSEGAHNSAEFEITEILQEGVNEIVAVVHKWCNGSYLEAQDMFRDNGIFRDVLLQKTMDNSIYDIATKTQKNKGGSYNLTVTPTFKLTDGCTFSAVLYDGEDIVASSINDVEKDKPCSVTFSALDVKEWSAELPNLYKLYLSLEKDGKTIEILRKSIGFKTIKIDGNIFYLNGQKIKLLGVNHHDTDSEKGFVMSVADMERDVKVMKDFNCNSVRTSHYPPDPTFLDFCDEYGLYVIDEADIEAHGCAAVYKPNLVSNNVAWKEHYWDRVYRMFQRDKNHACVTMWSLGNEAGGWRCQDYCYDNLKELTEIPIHYEGACRTPRKFYDVYSEMYTSVPRMKAYAKKKSSNAYKRPFFICEYAHAMGVGAGDLDKYVDTFYAHDMLMGGCIWEFADHAVLNADGPIKYTYGGDHGEFIHDKNFCVDGLFFPDRAPHSGAKNMQCAYRPVRASKLGHGTYRFENKMYFACAAGITLNWELRVDGMKYEDGIIPLDIKPQSYADITLPYQAIDKNKDNTIVFVYYNSNGGEIAKEQIELSKAKPIGVKASSGKITTVKSENKLIINYDNGSIIFNKSTGFIESYVVDKVEMINRIPERFHNGFGFELYRAPLDNDMYMRKTWDIMRLDRFSYALKNCKVEENEKFVKLALSFEGNTPVRYFWKDFVAKMELTYTVYTDGRIFVDTCLEKVKGISKLPRYGIVLDMPKEFDNVEYYGLGDEQNLSDFKEHVVLGVYKTKVVDMHEKYIRPQESGMHTQTRWAKLTNDDGNGLRFDFTDKYFTFNANHYTTQQLARCQHIEDVIEHNTTNVHIDGFMMGAGSGACGPGPSKGHMLADKNLSFSFMVSPIIAKKMQEEVE